MKRHLATALGALLLCLAGPALGQLPKGPGGPIDVMPMPKVIDLAINKRATGPVVAGQTATFVLEVSNNGNVTVNSGMGIQVIDPLPAGFSGPMTGFGAPWSCGQVGASLICNWNGGPVTAGSPFPPITVTAVAGDRDSYRQCASVRTRQGQDMRPENNNDCVDGRIERPQGGRYDVGIRKDGPSTVPLGQTATFTLQVTNQGPAPVGASVGLTVTDLVPVNFTNVTATGVGWNCILAGSQPTQVTCTYNGSQVNAGFQFPILTITGKVAKDGSWLQCAEVDFKKAEDGNPRDNRDCAEGRAGPGAKRGYDLGISKTYKPPSNPGGPATFILYPTNNGPSAVSGSTGVQVTDTLPPNFQQQIFVDGGWNWTCSINGGPPWTAVCDYIGPSVGPGPLPPIEILADVGEPGTFTNCAEILLRSDSDLKPGDNSSCVDGKVGTPTGKKPDINITKTALKQPWAWPSGTGVYQFRITNVGDTAVPAGHTFTLTENLPAGMVLVSTPSAWSCSPGAGTVGAATVICTYVSTVALNPTAFIQFDMTVGFDGKKEPKYTNCASVRVSDRDVPWPEINMDNNSDCEPVEVRPTPRVADLKIDKEGQPPIMVGQSMTFVLGVTNKGPDSVNASSGITVTDVLPGLFSPPVTVTAPDWNCPPPTGLSISCTYIGSGVFGPGDDLPPITVSAVATSAGQTENCAQVAIPGDPDPLSNKDCVTVVVRPAPPPSLGIDKELLECVPINNGAALRCTFRVGILNTSGAAWNAPIEFSDMLLPQGATVTLVAQPTNGWTCSGSQPMVCGAWIGMSIGGTAFVDYTVDITPPTIPQQNCASVTVPVSAGPACVPLGYEPPVPPTQFDLGLTSNFVETFTAVNGGAFEFRVSSTPTLANGAQLVLTGSVTTTATLTPIMLSPSLSVATPLWTCNGPWSGFVCTLNVAPGAWSGGLIPLQLKVYYSPNFVGLPLSFTGEIQMNGNADPVQSNNSSTVTMVLP